MMKNGKILEGMTSNFFYVIDPRAERRTKSADEAGLQEGASSPLRSTHEVPMIFREREICTAQRDILLGVTRRMVIRAARGRGVDVRYIPLKLDQLSAVDEAFLTSSSRGIVPVIQIDDVTIGQGSPGNLTRMLMSAYEEYVLSHAEEI